MKKKNNKSFDCVAFKHKAQSHIYKKIAGLDAADQAVYLEKAATQGSLGKWWQEVRRFPEKKISTQSRRSARN